MISSLLLTNASILNPLDETGNKADIFIRDGIVETIGSAKRQDAQCVLDASGLIVTPGLVDAHVHVYHDSACLGVDPQRHHLPRGVTYVIDQGSSGADNYEDFRLRVLFRTDIRCKSFLNCSRIGMPLASLHGAGELANPGNLDQAAFADQYTRHEKELLGVKIRLTPNICPHDPIAALDKTLAMAHELSIPVVVHPNNARAQIGEILRRLRAGDVYTHAYNNSNTGIVDGRGRVYGCVCAARERGVIFDTGHGATSMSFPVLKKAMESGFLPDTISTDLHNANINGPVYDMPTTISKFLCLGIPLSKAIRLSLHNPVKLFGLSDKATTIAEGTTADIAAFELLEGDFSYFDADAHRLDGKFKLVNRFTVLGQKLYMGR
jgi:dihydroorotase